MKNLFVLSVALLALVVVGCSDRSNSVGPVSDDLSIMTKAVPQTIDDGVITVSATIAPPDFGDLYSADGAITFSRSFDGNATNLVTEVKILLTNTSEVGNEKYVVAGQSSFVINSSIGSVADRMPLEGRLQGYDLELVYSVHSTIELKSISIVQSLPPTPVLAAPVPQGINGTVSIDDMITLRDYPGTYHVWGTVNYRLKAGEEFMTDTKVTLENVDSPTKETYPVTGVKTNPLNGKDQIVAVRFALSGKLAAFDLVISYAVGDAAKLMNVDLRPSAGPGPSAQ